jgi:acetyl esterase/lipase
VTRYGGRIRRAAAVAAAALLASVGVGAQVAQAATAVAPGARPSGSAPIEIERDIAYPAAGGATSTLDAYVVAGSAAGAHAAPAIVLVHGGGWQSGDKASLAGIATAFAQAGFSSFSVDYRLAPAAPYPAAVDDVAAVVRWLREPPQVQRFGIDPARMALFGVSAGGTIAAWVAMSGTGSLDRGARVRAVATWSGPMALVRYAVRRTPAAPTSSVAVYLGCDPRKCRSRELDASPVTHVDGSDPPMLVVNSRHELVPTDQARAMDLVLGNAGVDHKLLLFAGGRHAEQLAPVALAPTISFLRHALG